MPQTECGFEGNPGLLISSGPTLDVRIGFDPSFDSGEPRQPNIPDMEFPALVDTGATLSCIDSQLAIDLGLPVIGVTKFAGASGQGQANQHLAQIIVPSLEFTIYGSFAGVHLAAGGQPYKALLGRTFLRHFNLEYDGRSGTVSLSTN